MLLSYPFKSENSRKFEEEIKLIVPRGTIRSKTNPSHWVIPLKKGDKGVVDQKQAL